MSKYLLINADDFGMCNAANKAVFELFETGNLLSSTIMMPCPAAEDAVRFSIAHPEYAIGIHTTLTAEWQRYRWKPLTDGKSLLDEDGFMWHESDMVEKHVKLDEVETEVRAQIDKALNMGMKPSHADNHMGSLYGNQTGRFSLLKLAYRICGSYGLPYRMYIEADKRVLPEGVPLFAQKASTYLSKYWANKYNVLTPDYLLFPEWDKPGMRDNYGAYKRMILDIWTNIPDGITETFVHPALECDEIKGITGRWRDRMWEYQIMKDPEMHSYLESHGVTLISYRDLVEIRKTGKCSR